MSTRGTHPDCYQIARHDGINQEQNMIVIEYIGKLTKLTVRLKCSAMFYNGYWHWIENRLRVLGSH